MGLSTPFLKSEQLENYRLKLGYVHALLTFNSHTTPASITTSSNNAGVKMYAETSGQPTVSEDTQTNFGTLDSNAAPTTVGILAMCKDAAEFFHAQGSVVGTSTMTAFTYTKAGSSTTGVTALLSNLAIVGSLTTLDGDLQIAANVFQLELFYRKA